MSLKLFLSKIIIFLLNPYKLINENRDRTTRPDFTLPSDFNTEVSSAYGNLYEMFGYNMKGVSKRSAFIIVKISIVRYTKILENAGVLPNFKDINLNLEI